MKAIINLKNKANALSKEKLEQLKNNRTQDDAPVSSIGRVSVEAESGASRNSSVPTTPTKAGIKAVPLARPERCPILEHLIQSERRDAVKEEFFKQSSEAYTHTRHLNIKAATYNVNGRRPPSNLDLSPWLNLSGHPADVIAIGFQEIVPLNAQNIMLGASLEASADWEKIIDVCLNGDREEGHLVMNPAGSSESQKNTPSPVRPAAEGQRLTRLPSAEQPPSRAGNADAQTPRSTDTLTVVSDELDGYLSPAEDTASILSDDQNVQRSYVQVVGKQMVGVYLAVWVKQALLKHIRGVQTVTVGTGMMGYLGNKGAVAARMRIFDSGICFVSSHLSSGEQEGDEMKRNSDYTDIVRRSVFPTEGGSVEPDALSQRMNGGEAGSAAPRGLNDWAAGQWGSLKGVLDISHAIWIGDLNYRLNAADAKARALVKEANWSDLGATDQLNIARRDNQAFQGWEEGQLTFAPTYKFKRGTSQYVGAKDSDQDQPAAAMTGPERGQKQETEKTRTPAWTDRILWRSQGGLRQTSYSSANLFVSDHKPVVANFSLVAREYDRAKIQDMLELVKSAVQEREAAAVPRCELEPTTIEAGVVSYGEAKVVHTVLRNRGQVPAQWRFVPLSGTASENVPDEEIRLAPKWVKIHPVLGQLQPGESVEIKMTLWIDGGQHNTADYLVSLLKSKLDAAVILRVEDGNDIFCTIVGNLNPSVFGLSLSTLASMKRPISPAENWNSGSPTLKINVQKKHKGRQPSEGPPPEFFSPSAVIEEPTFDDVVDDDGNKIRQSSSLERSHVESANVHAHAGSNAETPSPETGELSTGLSSVDQMFAAFGLRSSEGDNQAEAQSELPPELVAMTDFLDSKADSIAEVFVASVGQVQLWQPRTPTDCMLNVERRWHQPAVQQIRQSLDQGKGVPSQVSTQDVAAAILCFFMALPDSLLPREAAHGRKVDTSKHALEHLRTYVAPSDYAVAEHMSGVLRQLVQRDSSPQKSNMSTLVRLLAEVWFYRSVEGFRRFANNSLEDEATSEDLNSAIDFVSALLSD